VTGGETPVQPAPPPSPGRVSDILGSSVAPSFVSMTHAGTVHTPPQPLMVLAVLLIVIVLALLAIPKRPRATMLISFLAGAVLFVAQVRMDHELRDSLTRAGVPRSGYQPWSMSWTIWFYVAIVALLAVGVLHLIEHREASLVPDGDDWHAALRRHGGSSS
jgi:xanthine/uracil permease